MTTTTEAAKPSLRERFVKAHEERVAEETAKHQRYEEERAQDDLNRFIKELETTFPEDAVAPHALQRDPQGYYVVQVSDLSISWRPREGRHGNDWDKRLFVRVECSRGCREPMWVEINYAERLGGILSHTDHAHYYDCLVVYNEDGDAISDRHGNPLPVKPSPIATPKVLPGPFTQIAVTSPTPDCDPMLFGLDKTGNVWWRWAREEKADFHRLSGQ